MAVKLGAEAFSPLLKCAMVPLFRAIETDQSNPKEACKELAQVRSTRTQAHKCIKIVSVVRECTHTYTCTCIHIYQCTCMKMPKGLVFVDVLMLFGWQELVQMLQELVGMELFYSQYNAVREAHKIKKDARKGEKVLQKLLDPSGAAEVKIKKNLKKRALAKRKIEGYREKRGGSKKFKPLDGDE